MAHKTITGQELWPALVAAMTTWARKAKSVPSAGGILRRAGALGLAPSNRQEGPSRPPVTLLWKRFQFAVTPEEAQRIHAEAASAGLDVQTLTTKTLCDVVGTPWRSRASLGLKVAPGPKPETPPAKRKPAPPPKPTAEELREARRIQREKQAAHAKEERRKRAEVEAAARRVVRERQEAIRAERIAAEAAAREAERKAKLAERRAPAIAASGRCAPLAASNSRWPRGVEPVVVISAADERRAWWQHGGEPPVRIPSQPNRSKWAEMAAERHRKGRGAA